MMSTPESIDAVHPQRGFLPERDPLRSLPGAFAAWDELAQDLPKLLPQERVRAAVDRLPRLDACELPEQAVRRAMLLLSFIGHAYVYQSWRTGVATCIPAVLAQPWHAVASRLGRPPILSYASYALDNWRRLDPSGPIALGNIALLQNFLGGLDEEWFVTVHVQIEALAAPALCALPRAQDAATRRETGALSAELEVVAAALQRMHHTLLRMPENCDPYIYYQRVRPFIHGWQLHPVMYEGVAEYRGEPQTFHGETGAQSSIIPCMDAALGVRHRSDELRVYLQAMRQYMPRGHVHFLEGLEARSDVIRSFVRSSGDAALREVYDACVGLVEAFRSTHLEYAARYIQKQAPVGANSTTYGTGGTPFMRYLKKHRDETHAHRIAT